MLVLKILGIIILLASILAALHFFNEHCDKKFSYRFFTSTSFWATAGTLGLLVLGNWWRTSALQSGGDVLNGIVIMCIGVLVAFGLIYFNFKHTNFVYGFGGSVLQLSAFGILAYIGFFVLIIGLFLWFLSNLDTQNVRVIND